MSIHRAIYGTNGVFVKPNSIRFVCREDLTFRTGQSPDDWLKYVRSKFGDKFADTCKSTFINWTNARIITDLIPNYIHVMEGTIIELKVPITREALSDHFHYFYGDDAGKAFDEEFFGVNMPKGYPPYLALLFVNYFIVKLKLQPIDLERAVLALYTANQLFKPQVI